MECRFPEGSVPRIPQTVVEAPRFGFSPFSAQELGYIGDNMDFGLVLDDLVSGGILDVDISPQTTHIWDDINLDTPFQFEIPPPPPPPPPPSPPATVLDRDVSGIIAGGFAPPWSPGHFLYSRFFRQETQPVFRPAVVSLTERLMRTTLRSYPNMMQTDGMPPFIHSTHLAQEDMRATLENCVSLALLWKSQREFNKRFVEESVERERFKLFNEV